MAAGTITYVYPVAGATAPTVAQIGLLSMVIVDAAFGINDTIATITHNLGTSAAGADGFPEISFCLTAGGVLAPLPIFAYTSANTITIVKAAVGATTDATYRVTIKRHTIYR